MLLLEKQQARWKSGSNEGPAREAAQWGHGGGKINSIPPHRSGQAYYRQEASGGRQ